MRKRMPARFCSGTPKPVHHVAGRGERTAHMIARRGSFPDVVKQQREPEGRKVVFFEQQIVKTRRRAVFLRR